MKTIHPRAPLKGMRDAALRGAHKRARHSANAREADEDIRTVEQLLQEQLDDDVQQIQLEDHPDHIELPLIRDLGDGGSIKQQRYLAEEPVEDHQYGDD